jgi:hypothetical protein
MFPGSVVGRTWIGARTDARPPDAADTRSVNQIEARPCTLQLAEGRNERCVAEQCAFWEGGGAVLPGDCLIERLGLDVRHGDLARYLLEVREHVEQARNRV